MTDKEHFTWTAYAVYTDPPTHKLPTPEEAREFLDLKDNHVVDSVGKSAGDNTFVVWVRSPNLKVV